MTNKSFFFFFCKTKPAPVSVIASDLLGRFLTMINITGRTVVTCRPCAGHFALSVLSGTCHGLASHSHTLVHQVKPAEDPSCHLPSSLLSSLTPSLAVSSCSFQFCHLLAQLALSTTSPPPLRASLMFSLPWVPGLSAIT